MRFGLRPTPPQTLMCLRHPNIVTVMGAVLEDGNAEQETLMVMEYMKHGSLSDLLINGTIHLDADVVLDVLDGIITGMNYLHRCTRPLPAARPLPAPSDRISRRRAS